MLNNLAKQFAANPKAAAFIVLSVILLAAAITIVISLISGKRLLGMRVLVVGIAAGFLGVIFTTVVLPQVTFHPKPSPWARDYTEQERRGRAIYTREGCWYCHSQFTRRQDQNLGPVSQPGDYAHETPNLLGTERTGPDLSNEGGKFPDEWHEAHIRDPRSVTPGSIMPSFNYLTDDELSDLIAYLQSLGRVGRTMTPKERENIPKFANTVKLSPAEVSELIEKVKAKHNPLELDVPGPYQEIEYGHPPQKKDKNPIEFSVASIVTGRGIFQQNCLPCHGTRGRGDGTAGKPLVKKPANFSLDQFDAYSDQKWFFRVSEGVPGTAMPRWGLNLTEEQRWYLVNYLKFLAAVPQDAWREPVRSAATTSVVAVEERKAGEKQ